MSVSPKQAKVFLDAYLEGDGNISERENSRMIRFATASETLARQVQMLLNKLDIQAWIQVREGGEAKFSNQQPERIINRNPLYQIGYTENKKWDMVRETETHFIVPVREVTREAFDDLVFNIDVAETHSYLVKGFAVHNCTAPQFDTNQLHAAVVELVALDDAEIKYSTVQNWYAGDESGKGGIFNFVTKRGACRGKNSKISWTQVETGSCDNVEISVGNFTGRQFHRRILFGRADQQRASRRHGNEDDSPRQKHEIHDYFQRNFRRKIEQFVSRFGQGDAESDGREKLYAVRFDAHRTDLAKRILFRISR